MVTRNKVLTRALAAAVLAVSLSACSGGNDDLRAYIDQVKARPGGRIEPLPQVHKTNQRFIRRTALFGVWNCKDMIFYDNCGKDGAVMLNGSEGVDEIQPFGLWEPATNVHVTCLD